MYKFDIDITPSLNGKEIHLEGICEMYTIIQLTGHTNERTFYKYVKAPPRTDCQAIGFQLYRIAIQAGISRDEIGDGFG